MSETAVESAPGGARHGRRTGWLVYLRDLAIIIVIALVVSFLLKTFLIRSFYIPSESMLDTLEVNDRIIVNELVPNVMLMAHGDVVVFHDPGGWLTASPPQETNWFLTALDWLGSLVGLTASDSDSFLIKRVIGLPGDEVVCCTADGRLTINGVEITEPYLRIRDGQDAAPAAFDVTVPDGHMWVMGDNRYNSRDSLAHMREPSGGFVPISTVVGKALVISWPIGRWTVLDNYPGAFEGVALGAGPPAGTGVPPAGRTLPDLPPGDLPPAADVTARGP